MFLVVYLVNLIHSIAFKSYFNIPKCIYMRLSVNLDYFEISMLRELTKEKKRNKGNNTYHFIICALNGRVTRLLSVQYPFPRLVPTN